MKKVEMLWRHFRTGRRPDGSIAYIGGRLNRPRRSKSRLWKNYCRYKTHPRKFAAMHKRAANG